LLQATKPLKRSSPIYWISFSPTMNRRGCDDESWRWIVEAAIFAIDLSDNLLVRLLITLSPIAVNGKKVDAADIEVSIVVIHIIDGVLLPSWVRKSIVNRVVANSDLFMAGLVNALARSGELTLVPPINSAFAKLSETIVDLLTSAEGRDFLAQTLLYYVLRGVFELYTSKCPRCTHSRMRYRHYICW
jgi:uncharacterized surface protein with fasciclin (FAS1) repeats